MNKKTSTELAWHSRIGYWMYCMDCQSIHSDTSVTWVLVHCHETPSRNISILDLEIYFTSTGLFSNIRQFLMWSQGHLVINRVLYYQWFLFFFFFLLMCKLCKLLVLALALMSDIEKGRGVKLQAYLCTRCQQCSDPFGLNFSSSLWVGAACHKLSGDLPEWGLKW